MKRQYSTLKFTRDLYKTNKQVLSFNNIKTKKNLILWQAKLKKKLIQLLGGFPEEKCKLNPEVIEIKNFKNYSREKIIFQSRHNTTVISYLLIPEGFKTPGPVVICLPGHGRGVDSIIGINEDGTMRNKYGEYQNDFALQCVDNGFAAFAIEQFGFGYRKDENAVKRGVNESSCQPAAGAAFLFGETMIGWRVYDVIRTIDYLNIRKEIDKKRIGCMGISDGGTITLFSSAVDNRIKVAVVSGYFNTFKDSIMSIFHCIDNYVPNILKYAEMYDIAGLIFPRYIFTEAGIKDPVFPISAFNRAFNKLKGLYKKFGYEERIDREIFNNEHIFYGKKAIKFLKKWL